MRGHRKGRAKSSTPPTCLFPIGPEPALRPSSTRRIPQWLVSAPIAPHRMGGASLRKRGSKLSWQSATLAPTCPQPPPSSKRIVNRCSLCWWLWKGRRIPLSNGAVKPTALRQPLLAHEEVHAAQIEAALEAGSPNAARALHTRPTRNLQPAYRSRSPTGGPILDVNIEVVL